MKERSLSDVRNTAIGLLARREHSQRELHQKLNARSLDRAFIDEVVEALAKEGLQSDSRFCEAYIQSRVNKGFGPVRIRLELGERAVAEEIIDACFDEMQVDWLTIIEGVHSKKFGKTFPKDFERRMKQSNFLQYRGFTSEQINKLFK